MKILHEYNYDSLEQTDKDIFEDVSKLKLLWNYVGHFSWDNGALCLFNDLVPLLEQHCSDLESVVGRILRCAVPPEGEEEIPELVYSEPRAKVS